MGWLFLFNVHLVDWDWLSCLRCEFEAMVKVSKAGFYKDIEYKQNMKEICENMQSSFIIALQLPFYSACFFVLLMIVEVDLSMDLSIPPSLPACFLSDPECFPRHFTIPSQHFYP